MLPPNPAQLNPTQPNPTPLRVQPDDEPRELELFTVCAEVPPALAQLLPRLMGVSDFKLRKDIPIQSMQVGARHGGWACDRGSGA